jgi:hypothetical protein
MPDPRFAALGTRILKAARMAVAAHLELAEETHRDPVIEALPAEDPAADEGAAG